MEINQYTFSQNLVALSLMFSAETMRHFCITSVFIRLDNTVFLLIIDINFIKCCHKIKKLFA